MNKILFLCVICFFSVTCVAQSENIQKEKQAAQKYFFKKSEADLINEQIQLKAEWEKSQKVSEVKEISEKGPSSKENSDTQLLLDQRNAEDRRQKSEKEKAYQEYLKSKNNK